MSDEDREQELAEDARWVHVGQQLNVRLNEDLKTAKLYITGQAVVSCTVEELTQLGAGVRDLVYDLAPLTQLDVARILQNALGAYGETGLTLLGAYHLENSKGYVLRFLDRKGREFMVTSWADFKVMQREAAIS